MAHGFVRFRVERFPDEFKLQGGKIVSPRDDLGELMQFMVETTSRVPGEAFDPDGDLQIAKRLQRVYGSRFEVVEHEPPTFDGSIE